MKENLNEIGNLEKYSNSVREYSKILDFLCSKGFILTNVNRWYKNHNYAYNINNFIDDKLTECNSSFCSDKFRIGFSAIDASGKIYGIILFSNQRIEFNISSFENFTNMFMIAEETYDISSSAGTNLKLAPLQKFVFIHNNLFIEYPLIVISTATHAFRCASIIADKPYLFIVKIIDVSDFGDNTIYDYFQSDSVNDCDKPILDEVSSRYKNITYKLPEKFFPTRIFLESRISENNNSYLDLLEPKKGRVSL